jgi:hypothetical protein
MATAVKRPKRRHWKRAKMLHYYGIAKRAMPGYLSRMFSDNIFDAMPLLRKGLNG